jgi:hypothetical protein
MRILFCLFATAFILFGSSCDKNEGEGPDVEPNAATDLKLNGTGSYTFKEYTPLSEKPVLVYYHVPVGANSETPLLIVFHGNGRDALESRDAMKTLSENNDFIVLVPEFSSEFFPGSDQYHLGNVFEDGDNPSAANLNDEEEWTFSLIEPIFEDFKTRSDLAVSNYDVFGHSAGGQVAHRFFFLKPDAKVNRVISAASGWYTVPDYNVDFPYGLGETPVSESVLKELFERKLTIMIGDNDTDPNSFGLRHTEEADVQGVQRFERANYFYNTSQQLALDYGVSYRWQFKSIANAGHDFGATSNAAVALLY